MRNLFTLALTSALFTGCYASHAREEMESPVVCPAESTDSVVRYDVLEAEDVTVEAGTRRAALVTFRVREMTHAFDTAFAEFPYRFAAVMGSLTAPDGGPVFSRARLRLSDRTADFGPDNIIAVPGEEVVEGELWDNNMLRAGHEVVFTLEVDVAEGAEGTYEIRLGDECDLTPRMWYVPEDPPTVEMPLDRIGGNEPITIRVTVVPADEV